MNKFSLLSGLICLSFLFFACSDSENPIDIIEEMEAPSTVNFSNLEVGQKSYYKMYLPTCASSSTTNITIDTLVLEVVSAENNEYVFSETLFNNEAVLPGFTSAEKAVSYDVSFNGDYLLIPDRLSSKLFWFYANDTLHLNPEPSRVLKQQDCFLLADGAPFIGEEIAWIDDFELENIAVKDKLVVSCVPNLGFQLDAYLIYDEFSLTASHQLFTDFNSQSITSTTIGWEEFTFDDKR